MKRSSVMSRLAMPALMTAALVAGGGRERASSQELPSGPARAQQAADPGETAKRLAGTVVETMNAGGYTYVRIESGGEKVWAAGPQCQVAVGDAVDLAPGTPMANFHSKTLDRTFDVIYFVPSIGAKETASAPAGLPAGHPAVGGGEPAGPLPGHGPIGAAKPKEAPLTVEVDSIAKPEGGTRVEEIYAQKDRLAGQTVLVRGKVVKFTAQVMGTNWLHLRDGTGSEGSNDLTVTTEAKVEAGDTVLVQGALAVDKDFGFGYKYEVLVENAKVTVE